jgi:hypothetical protein
MLYLHPPAWLRVEHALCDKPVSIRTCSTLGFSRITDLSGRSSRQVSIHDHSLQMKVYPGALYGLDALEPLGRDGARPTGRDWTASRLPIAWRAMT